MKKIIKALLRLVILLFVLLNIVVIFHAYKFTHYYDNGDPAVIPQALKSGTDKTKDILFGINAQKKKETATDADLLPVTLKTKDGLALDCWNIKVPEAKGTFIMFHGHGSNKSDILPQARALQQLGYNTFLVSFRAHGNSGGNTCTIGFEEAEDVKAAYEFVQAEKEKNILIYGVSLGAATVMKAVNDFGLAPQKMILEMPFGSLQDAVEARVKLMKLPVQPISSLLCFWGGTIHGFWAFNMKPSAYAKKINCPVLLQWGMNDPRVSKTETDDIFANISSPKKLVVYENSGHQNLYTNETGKWLQNVGSFLSSK